jgi:hypothetical protein
MGVVVERLTDVLDALNQRVLGDDDILPDVIDQFAFRNEPAGVLNQIHEDVEGLWPQRQNDAIAPQTGGSAIDDKSPETIACGFIGV